MSRTLLARSPTCQDMMSGEELEAHLALGVAGLLLHLLQLDGLVEQVLGADVIGRLSRLDLLLKVLHLKK